MLVWDENHRLDRYAEVEALVRRDRNHPSVVSEVK
jgi:beta-galactosidase/beta-glucuronidase